MDKKVAFGGIAIILLLIAVSVAISRQAAAAANQVALQLTDPPQVPSGTQHLLIGYSSLRVHLSNANNASGWLPASGSGSIDLMQILNLTQTIGTVRLPANSSIESVRFNVTSATITINRTTYNLTVPSSKVTAHVTGRTSVNASSSILLDLSPVVVTIVTNSTSVFVLVPSVRAVVVAHGTNSTSIRLGARGSITAHHREALERSELNLTITKASIAALPGNATRVTVTVKNDANTSVVLRHVALFGNATVLLNLTSVRDRVDKEIAEVSSRINSACARLGISANASVSAKAPTPRFYNTSGLPSVASEAENEVSGIGNIASRVANATAGRAFNVPTGGIANVSSEIESRLRLNISPELAHIPEGSDISEHINASACTSAGITALKQRVNSSISRFSAEARDRQEHFKFVLFSVTGSGSLLVPSDVEDAENLAAGMSLGAGQSATLSFNGMIALARGHVVLVPVAGKSYRIAVQGEDDAFVKENVTAT